jgi:glycogen synthase
MRILFITAFYPPHVVGGWEQLVRDVNLRLRERRHETHVLTSQHGVDGPVTEPSVSRLLTLESDLYHYRPLDYLGHRRRLAQNMAHTEAVIREFKPDVVFVHVMFNLSHAIPWQAEQLLPGRVVYYVANDWPHEMDPHTAYWSDGGERPLLSWLKQLVAPWPLRQAAVERGQFRLEFRRVLCVSEAVRRDLQANAGIAPEALHVVYNGVETDQFAPERERPLTPGHLSLLYAGSMVQHKGVHTAVLALAELHKRDELDGIELFLVGSGHPDYERKLYQLVREAGLETAVHFVGRVPRAQMPQQLQRCDVLLFPSIWEEPLSRMMQEGMAAGLVVVGTLTGGSGELLVKGETGLTFPPGDHIMLADRILTLKQNPDLVRCLSQNGREAVVARFDIERMIDGVEYHLLETCREHLVTGN